MGTTKRGRTRCGRKLRPLLLLLALPLLLPAQPCYSEVVLTDEEARTMWNLLDELTVQVERLQSDCELAQTNVDFWLENLMSTENRLKNLQAELQKSMLEQSRLNEDLRKQRAYYTNELNSVQTGNTLLRITAGALGAVALASLTCMVLTFTGVISVN